MTTTRIKMCYVTVVWTPVENYRDILANQKLTILWSVKLRSVNIFYDSTVATQYYRFIVFINITYCNNCSRQNIQSEETKSKMDLCSLRGTGPKEAKKYFLILNYRKIIPYVYILSFQTMFFVVFPLL